MDFTAFTNVLSSSQANQTELNDLKGKRISSPPETGWDHRNQNQRKEEEKEDEKNHQYQSSHITKVFLRSEYYNSYSYDHSSLMRFLPARSTKKRTRWRIRTETITFLQLLRVLTLTVILSMTLPSSEGSTVGTTNVFPTESRLSHNFISSSVGSNSDTTSVVSLSEDEILLARLRYYWECRLEQRQHEYNLMSQDTNEVSNSCPVTFDGWVCWEATKAGTEKVVTCPPSYYPTTDNQSVRSAIRRCFNDSTWEEAVMESETNEDTPLAHPCSPTHAESLRQDNVFWMVIASTSEIEADMYPYTEDVIAESYESCVLSTLSIPPSVPKEVAYCPRTFDGWSCWNDTLAGNIAYVNCPSYGSPGFDTKRLAHKVCSDDGTWFRHPTTNRIWSNYTTCVDREDLRFREQINNVYVTGYSISVTALIISLVIFFVFNSLKCGRVTIHKNLFVSFIVNNVLWIIWYTAIVPYPEVIFRNPASCQVLHVVLQYFLVCTYFWMFCEGFYLHTLLVLAFVSEPRIMRMLYVIGWGLPLILIIIYTSVRMSYDDAVVFCWIEEHGTSWILSGPVGISMFLNLAFLINIVRVLVTKLRAVNSPDNHHTRYYYTNMGDIIPFLKRGYTRLLIWKAARATLILIPLLGLHYVIVPFRPEPGSHGERIYQTTAAIATSFQGFCVALLFCFFNGEVIALVRKRWKQEIMMRQKDRRTSYAATTISIGARHMHYEETQSSRASNASQKLMSEL